MAFFRKRSVSDLGEKKKDMPEGLWVKCPSCGESLYEQTLAKNLRVCMHCNHHFTLNSDERIASLVDEGSFREIDAELDSVNALGFKDYLGKVKAYQNKTGIHEAVVTGKATIAPLVKRFLEGIRKGESPSPSFEDGVRAQLVLDAVLRSLEAGGWQRVEAA